MNKLFENAIVMQLIMSKEKGKEAGSETFIRRFHAFSVLVLIAVVGFFVYTNLK